MPDNKIGLEAVFEDENFQSGISGYNSSIKDADSATSASASSMGDAWIGLSSVGQLAWAGLAVGIAAATAEMYLAIDAAMETEDIMAAMEFQVGKTGEKTGITADMVNDLAASLSNVVPIDDEVITQAITMGMRFDGVTKNNIEPMIKAAADLAISTGKSLPAAMKELAMAVSDPDKAMRLLKDANITLSDAEMKTLKGFKDVGDAAGASAFLIGRVNDKIGGLGAVMGDTAKGKMTIMQTALGNLQETLGGGLMDSLKGVFDKITVFANDPRTLAFLEELGSKVGAFASSVVDSLPSIMDAFDSLSSWFVDNKPIVIGVLSAIGAAMVAFGVTSAAAGVTAVAPFLPVIAILAAVGAAAAILTKAWQEDWGGMQGKFKAAWDKIKPMLDKLQKWLGENIPKAIKVLSDFWEKVLLPAIKKVVIWWVDNVLPMYVKEAEWIGENLPKAIKVLSDYWEKVLLPAIKTVVDWINANIAPLFDELVNWLGSNIPKAIQILSNYWSNVLLPAIRAVYEFVNTYLIPIFNAIVTVMSNALTTGINNLSALWNNVLLPAIRAVYDFITTYLIPIFNTVVTVVSGVVTMAINNLSALWNNILLPAIRAVYNIINDYLIPMFNAVSGVMNSALSLAIRALTGLWQNVLLPAIESVWDFINRYLSPILSAVAGVMNGVLTTAINNLKKMWLETLLPAITEVWEKLEPFRTFLAGTFTSAIMGIRNAWQWIIDALEDLQTVLDNFELPGWLTPGSPTPFEMGLRGINEQLDKMAHASLPTIRHQMEVLGTVRDVTSGSGQIVPGNSISNSSQRTNNYIYGASFNVDSQSGMLDILQGLA